MTTPMRRQYMRIKKQYPDTIVFFRLGDFYETFDDDAKVVAQVCDIVLTSRPVGKDQRVPLAGVPYHSVDGYLAKLIKAGHRVAMVEQIGEVPAKGLVEREVVRVVTPGTVTDPGLLEERRNNYLVAIVADGERVGLAHADITTGEFATTQFQGPDVSRLALEEIQRLGPAEVVICRAQVLSDFFGSGTSTGGSSAYPWHLTEHDQWPFELETARQTLQDQFEVASLDGFGVSGLPLAVRAAGGLLHYLSETQHARLRQLTTLRTYSTEQYMLLDAATRRNLELTESLRQGSVQGSLLGVLDATVTSMGGRRLRKWINQPLLDIEQLNERLDAVSLLHRDTAVRTRLRSLLKDAADVERLASRVVQGIARPRDLIGIRQTLTLMPDIVAIEVGVEAPVFADLDSVDACRDVVDLLEQAIVPEPPATISAGGVIQEGFSSELDNIIAAAREAKDWVANLERTERKRTGIKSLKVGFNKVFGYYLEVTKANLDHVPEEYIRKQTLVNAERYITPELKEYESLILNAEQRQADLEGQIYSQVVEQVAAAARRLLRIADLLARLDVVAALAEVAMLRRYVRPELALDGALQIRAGRHPVVEVAQREEPFVPNDVHFDEQEAILLITGPNMAGKSTYLRQVALTVLMAQIGSFVPADSAQVPLVDRIFTRIGAQDEISAGQSTFMVEMVETANLLNHASSRSLLVLDEVGRGTSTYDGISIAWAVVEHIHNHPRLRCKTLFATHYHELTQLAQVLPHVRNYNVAVAEEEDKVVFLRRIVPGGADRSYGIHVAQLAGLPRAVIHRAEEILGQLQQEARAPCEIPRGVRVEQVQQLPLFSIRHPLVDELQGLDVTSMTPLEAITKLYELQRRAKDQQGD